MNIEIDTVKGFKDYLPPESLKKEAVKKVIEKYFTLYGFLPVETPIVEFDELMKPSILPSEEEDEAVSDRFRLRDRAGRNLGLRYEFTFQLARIFKQNPNIKLPFRRYQIGPVFRDEPIGKDRFRQFIQCDADIIGDLSIKADAECIALASNILKELKIDIEIEVNNKKLIAAIIESVEIKETEKVMKELDKINKIGEDMVKTNLRKYADSNKVLTLFKLLCKDLSFFKENAFDGADDLKELEKECSLLGVKIRVNPFLVRGLSYYTGNIFEIKQREKNTIAAGGRYNNLAGKYINKEIPAVGISFGLERIAEIANINIELIPKVLIVSLEKDIETLKLTKKLRKAGISCVISYDKLSKALEYANAVGILNVIIIGQEEIDKKKYKLKEMQNGQEEYITEKQLIKALKR